jgi:SAM-dependent methyltransferase
MAGVTAGGSTRRETCGGCGSSLLLPFLDLGSSPLADRFPASPDEPETWYPLRLAVCESCWLVQLTEVVPDEELWGADYGFYTGASPALARYFEDYANWLISEFTDLVADGLTVEVACNDGTLLHHLHDAGCRTLGVEPSTGPADSARARGLNVAGDLFGVKTAGRIAAEHGQASLIVANNVAAHVADLPDFLGGIRDLLAPEGVAVIEVQYLPDLLLGNGFDHVYHEHRSFFSVGTLAEALARAGLIAQNVAANSTQGGSIRVVATHPGGSADPFLRARRLAAHGGEEWTRRPDAYASIQGRADRLRERLLDLLAEQAHHRVVGYGASAKSATLLNWCGIGPRQVEAIHDLTPAKVGRYTPGSHIPIVGTPLPAVSNVTALLFVHNYLGGVIRREREFLDAGGRFLIPIPAPVIL